MSADNLWDCEYFLRCKNNTRCLSCGPDQRLLKVSGDKQRTQSRSKIRAAAVTSVSDNSGATLEDYVRDRFNSLPTVKEWLSRRQIGSGNIWFMPGDVADSVVLVECKERLTVNSKGEKSMTIPKTMIEKVAEEAEIYNSYPALVFRYKGDETGNSYFVQDFEVLCEMVHEIKFLRHEGKSMTNERDMYKQVSEELHKEVQRLKRKCGEE